MLPASQTDKHQLMKKASEDARQYVYRILSNFILTVILPPGNKVNEQDVADTLKVSRTPVHDTLIRLAREHLLRIIPKKGAYVMPIDLDLFNQSVWMHLQMGTATLNSIFIMKRDSLDLDILNYILHEMDQDITAGNSDNMSRYVFEYYHRLYLLSGGMEQVWESLMHASNDFKRILSLGLKSPSVAKRFLYDLSALTDALVKRDNDLACEIYQTHLNHTHQIVPVLKQKYPAYFRPL